ncbi:MAG: DNA mismatch repair protein MutS [Deltaproteobacteria bacterium]|nr:DNA mismatch repair protein MutS [Deltaproteobacteria bacterium]
MHDPHAELQRRLAARQAAVADRDRADARIGTLRLAVFAAAVGTGWLSLAQRQLAAWWLLAPLLAFVALVFWHDRVIAARALARRAAAFHERALARLDGRIAGTGTPGDGLAPPEHPCAADLDLFGPGSVFELLCAARTRPGEERLAAWLLQPAAPDALRARQRAVAALAPRLDLREELDILGDEVRAAVDARALAGWGAAAPLAPAGLLPGALAMAAATVAAAAGWAAGLFGGLPLAAALLAQWALSRSVREPVARTLAALDRPAAELRVLALLLARLEREPFDDERLRALQATLRGGRRPASARIAALVAASARIEWAHNQFFAPIAFGLSWRPLHAALVERWRLAHGREIGAWLDAMAELEALSSLAGRAYEHPADPFPEIVEPGPDRHALLEGEALRHPLLPQAVPNDVRLGGDGPRVLLVSGSNMSGKSTYLRTVGVNVVLALAGAPVPAARLRLTPLAVGATLRIQDSLQAGRSRFYAEITRLRQISDLAAGEVPLLFLLDEILHGTNSHDRRIGAEAVIRALAARGAAGIVTTHDLALTALAGADGSLANAHFEDQVRDGQIAFDFRLRPGVVTHSNALALMRGVGLEV